MKKIRVGIVFGGSSSEYLVSIESAKNIVRFIDKSKFEIILLLLDQKNRWFICDNIDVLFNKNQFEFNSSNFIDIDNYLALMIGDNPYYFMDLNDVNLTLNIDVIFPIIHGSTGEDGVLQGLLQISGIPFVGSRVLSSAISMDKDIMKRLLRDAGLVVANSVTLMRSDQFHVNFQNIIETFGLPLFIKPANQGSSIGISKIFDDISFYNALCLAFFFDNKVLIESAVVGRELECAVLGNEELVTSLCGEIISEDFYNYNNKYISRQYSQIIIPAKISNEISNKIRRISLHAFRALNCMGMARVDVFLTKEDDIIINEINTIPGFTSKSVFPKLWEVSGLNCTTLITKLIELAMDNNVCNYKNNISFDLS